jgi:hypothetical protein
MKRRASGAPKEAHGAYRDIGRELPWIRILSVKLPLCNDKRAEELVV